MKRGGLVVELLGMVLECASPPLPVVVRIDVLRETRNEKTHPNPRQLIEKKQHSQTANLRTNQPHHVSRETIPVTRQKFIEHQEITFDSQPDTLMLAFCQSRIHYPPT